MVVVQQRSIKHNPCLPQWNKQRQMTHFPALSILLPPCLPAIPQPCQVCPYSICFACAVPSAWNALPPGWHRVLSLASIRTWLKYQISPYQRFLRFFFFLKLITTQHYAFVYNLPHPPQTVWEQGLCNAPTVHHSCLEELLPQHACLTIFIEWMNNRSGVSQTWLQILAPKQWQK